MFTAGAGECGAVLEGPEPGRLRSAVQGAEDCPKRLGLEVAAF